jgi:hypothetical protein
MFSRLIQTIIVKIFINFDKDLHLFIDGFKFEIQILDQNFRFKSFERLE